MFESIKEGRREVGRFLESLGFDPLYFATAIMVGIVLAHWKWFKRWDDLPKDQKGILRALVFATTIGVVASVLKLTGAF